MFLYVSIAFLLIPNKDEVCRTVGINFLRDLFAKLRIRRLAEESNYKENLEGNLSHLWVGKYFLISTQKAWI